MEDYAFKSLMLVKGGNRCSFPLEKTEIRSIECWLLIVFSSSMQHRKGMMSSHAFAPLIENGNVYLPMKCEENGKRMTHIDKQSDPPTPINLKSY